MTWNVEHVDCVEGIARIATDSIDHTITDPPYEAEAHGARRVKPAGWRQADFGDGRGVEDAQLDFAPMTGKLRRAIGAEIGRVTKAWAILFCQPEAIAAWRVALEHGGLHYRRAIPWVKPDAQPALHGRFPGQAFETIVIASKPGARAFASGGTSLWYRYSKTDGRQRGEAAPHQTTKPLRLMLDLVDQVAIAGDTVLDPFCGSGTTGVACKRRGVRFIGFDNVLATTEVARQRIAGDARVGAAQPRLL